jgi:CRP-like cAMP-binding protein
MYKIKRKKCIKNQNIIKEGEPITEIYIIKGGEFEVSSKVEQK